MNKKEIAKIEAMKKAARQKAEQAVVEKKNNRKRGGYDAEELKERWLEDFGTPTTRNKEHARILKEKYYKDHRLTVDAIYLNIYRWTKQNAEALSVPVSTE